VTALNRERDELIALLDVQEQSRYVRSKSVSSTDEEYSSYSSTEVTVLFNLSVFESYLQCSMNSNLKHQGWSSSITLSYFSTFNTNKN